MAGAAASGAPASGVKPAAASDQMLMRRIPSSGEMIPAIGLGTSGPFEVGAERAARDPLRDVLKAFFAHGATLSSFIDEMRHTLRALAPEHPAALLARDASLDSVGRLSTAAESLLASLATAPDRAMAVSVPFLKLCGITIGGWLMARAADIAAQKLAAGNSDREFMEAKIASAHFYATQVLPQVLALEQIVVHGGEAVVATDAALI